MLVKKIFSGLCHLFFVLILLCHLDLIVSFLIDGLLGFTLNFKEFVITPCWAIEFVGLQIVIVMMIQKS